MTTQALEPAVTTGNFTREAVEALSRGRGEPAWLRERRLSAWQQAAVLPLPASYERAWKYFKPEQIAFRPDLTLAERGTPNVADPVRAGAERGIETETGRSAKSGGRGKGKDEGFSGTLTEQDGAATGAELIEEARAQGVILASLETAAREHPELVQKYLGTVVGDGEHAFVALNAAFWSGGTFVYVPRDVEVELPLHAVRTLTGADTALFPRTLVIVDRGARAAFLDERAGGDGASFVSAVTELVLEDESRLRHYSLQRWGDGVQELFYQRADIGRNAELVTAFVGLGAQAQKGWVESRIRGTAARSDIFGAVLGTGDQVFDMITTQEHIGDHSLSDLLIKSALKDRSQSAYYGMTRVDRYARMSDANQEDRNLLLSDRARANAEPVLEILTSEVVRCAHGASAGPVDPEQLFYLETRGLPRPVAEQLLVQGFLGGVLARLPDEHVRDLLGAAIEEKLT